MAWWKIWRKVGGNETESDAGVRPVDVADSVTDTKADSAPADPRPADSGSTIGNSGSTATIHRVTDHESAPAGVASEPQGWRLLAPPTLLSAVPMPTTFNSSLQRSLASHIPTDQLAATSRALGHDLRADGPIGTVKSVLRTVSASAADVLPATLASGPDLVLRRKVLPPEEAAVFGVPVATQLGGTAGRPVLGAVAPQEGLTSSGEAIKRQVEAVDGGANDSSPTPVGNLIGTAGTDGPLEAGPGTSTDGTGTTPPIFRKVAPILGNSEPIGALTFTTAPSIPTPKEQGRLTASEAPLVSASSPGSGNASVVSRSADGSDGISQASPASARQRRFVEVRQGEPVSLASFAPPTSSASESPSAGSSVPTSEPTPTSHREISSSVIARSTDSSEVQSSAANSAGEFEAVPPTPVVPTLGRRAGLGMPMTELPATAVLRAPEPDPFAGWNDNDTDLPLAGQASVETLAPNTGHTAAANVARSFASVIEAAAPVASSPSAITRAVDDLSGAATVSGEFGDLPKHEVGVPAPTTVGEVSRTTSPEELTVGSKRVTLQPLASHAPLISQRAFDMSTRQGIDALTLPAGTAVASTPVPLQWGVDNRPAPAQSTTSPSAIGTSNGSGAVVNRSFGGGAGGSTDGGKTDSASRHQGSGIDGTSLSERGGSSLPTTAVHRVFEESGTDRVGSRSTGPGDRSEGPGFDTQHSVVFGANEAPARVGDGGTVVALQRTPDSTDAGTRGESNPGLPFGDLGGRSPVLGMTSAPEFPGPLAVPSNAIVRRAPAVESTPSFPASNPTVPLSPIDSAPSPIRSWSFEPSNPGGDQFGAVEVAGVSSGPAASDPVAVERSFGAGGAASFRSLPLAGLPPTPASGGQSFGTLSRFSDGAAAFASAPPKLSTPVLSQTPSFSPNYFVTEVSSDEGFGQSFISRQAEDGGGSGGSEAATAVPSDSGGASSTGGEPGAGAGSTAQAEAELEQLAGKLYERIRQRLRRELLDDRERSGFALDRMR